MANLENTQVFEILQFKKLYNFQNLTFWKIIFFILLFGKSIFYDLIKLLNVLIVQIILKNEKSKFNSETLFFVISFPYYFICFVILKFAILRFRNIDCSTVSRSKLVFQIEKNSENL